MPRSPALLLVLLLLTLGAILYWWPAPGHGSLEGRADPRESARV